MIVRVYRKGAEIFAVSTVESSALSFPYNTRIDRIESEQGLAKVFLAEAPAEQPGALEPLYAERVLVGSGKFIYAIKSYRTRTGVSLREAKEVMDKLRATLERDGERY